MPASAAAASCQASGSSGGAYTISVCLDSPAGGDSMTGDATVAGSSSVTSGAAPAVQRLVFYVDGAYALTDFDAPYSFKLPTARWVDGPHRIEVEALLRDGFVSQRASADVTFSNGVTTPPANNKQWAPTAGSTPAAGSPFVLAAVGDGAGGETSARTVVDRIKSWSPNLMLYLGDVYEKGAPSEFKNWYGSPTSDLFGQFRSITDPVVGNHEYSASPTAGGYFDFWDNIPHYYSFDTNGWHLIALDSTSQFGQTASGSPMYQWLQADLRANTQPCVIAYWHHPRFNVGPEGYATRMDEIWNLLAAHRVAIVLTGHDHDYQRWVPLDGSGNASADGVTEFVAGTGGHSEQSFVATDTRVAAAFSNTQFGALRMELNSDGAGYQFVTAAGQRLDSGSVKCPGTAKDAAAPTTPSGLTAVAKSRAEINVSWSQSTDNVGVTGYDIYRNGALLKSIGPDTTFADGTVAPNNTYTYTVKARDAAGNVSPAGNGARATTPALGVLFSDGFESGDLTQWTTNTNVTVTSSRVFSGSYAARAVNTGASTATWATKRPATPQSSFYYQARVFVASQGATPVDLMRFRSAASTPARLLSVLRSASGKLSIRNETTATTTTTKSASGVLPLGSWHTIQTHVVVSGASSQVETWLDGIKIADLSFTLSLGTTPIGWLDLGEFTKGRTYDVAFDDVAGDTSAIPDVTAPTTPSGVKATSPSGLQVDLSWSGSSDDVGIAGYDVYRNGVQVGSTAGSATKWSDATVAPQASYFYQVRARDGAGNVSALSDLVTITTGPAFSDGFETGDMSRWTTSSGVTPESGTGFSGSYAARATASLAPAYASAKLPSTPAELYYRVRFKILSRAATSPINLLRFRTGGSLAIWTVSVGADGTLQARNDVTGVTTKSGTQVTPGTWHELQAHLLVQGATGDSDIWLDGQTVTPFSGTANFGAAGIGKLELGDATGTRTFDALFDDVVAASSFIPDDTPPTAPANLQATSVSGSAVTLAWDAATDNTGVASYDIYRDGQIIKSIGPATRFTDTTVQAGATYVYEVRANDAAGNTSSASNVVSVTASGTTPQAPYFSDGFESGTLAAWTNSGLTAQQTNVFAGSWAARALSTAGTAAYATAVLPAPQSDLTYRLHFIGNTAWPSTGVYLMKLRTAANASIVGVYVSSTGKLAYRNDAGAVTFVSTTPVSSGAWHELAVHLTIAGTSGSIDVVLDGTRLSGFPRTDNFGTASAGKIQLGDNSTGRNFDVASDEVLVTAGG